MNEERITVTVIVPVYNAQATIDVCADAILSQELPDGESMEVIFVNDGSRDHTFDSLNEAIGRHPGRMDSTKVLHYPYRQGAAAALRIGLEHARGEWIIKCDADDELHPGALSDMILAARREQADVVVGRYLERTPSGKTIAKSPQHHSDINKLRLCVDHFSMWNKLLRRSLLLDNNIWPVDGVDCWEDLMVVARAYAMSHNVAWLQRQVYTYNLNPGSLSRSSRDTVLRHHLKAALLLEQWFAARGLEKEYEPFLNRVKLIAKVKFLRGKHKDVKAWLSTFPEVNSRIMSISGVAIHYKLMFKAVAILPPRFSQWLADITSRLYNTES